MHFQNTTPSIFNIMRQRKNGSTPQIDLAEAELRSLAKRFRLQFTQYNGWNWDFKKKVPIQEGHNVIHFSQPFENDLQELAEMLGLTDSINQQAQQLIQSRSSGKSTMVAKVPIYSAQQIRSVEVPAQHQKDIQDDALRNESESLSTTDYKEFVGFNHAGYQSNHCENPQFSNMQPDPRISSDSKDHIHTCSSDQNCDQSLEMGVADHQIQPSIGSEELMHTQAPIQFYPGQNAPQQDYFLQQEPQQPALINPSHMMMMMLHMNEIMNDLSFDRTYQAGNQCHEDFSDSPFEKAKSITIQIEVTGEDGRAVAINKEISVRRGQSGGSLLAEYITSILR
ncbi:hypothetical protein FGO68_gene13331 [Halteria grandinella]|uniref:Uncharacterized protein n=1 Tax=Halteria grandinella TaxID=5974 RepID=A0A8J8NPJ3_HALGN|nr:hypothetical protein FGO68_gene13331 [Halteria grandinella]